MEMKAVAPAVAPRNPDTTPEINGFVSTLFLK